MIGLSICCSTSCFLKFTVRGSGEIRVILGFPIHETACCVDLLVPRAHHSEGCFVFGNCRDHALRNAGVFERRWKTWAFVSAVHWTHLFLWLQCTIFSRFCQGGFVKFCVFDKVQWCSMDSSHKGAGLRRLRTGHSDGSSGVGFFLCFPPVHGMIPPL